MLPPPRLGASTRASSTSALHAAARNYPFRRVLWNTARSYLALKTTHSHAQSICVYSTSMCCGTYRCAQRGLRSWLRVGTPCTCLSICNQLAATRGGRGVCTPAMMRPSVRGTTASSCSRVEMTKSGLLPRAARIPARSGFPILFPPVVT